MLLTSHNQQPLLIFSSPIPGFYGRYLAKPIPSFKIINKPFAPTLPLHKGSFDVIVYPHEKPETVLDH